MHVGGHILRVTALMLLVCGLSRAEQVEKWDVFELELRESGWENPFLDVELRAVFTSPSGAEKVVHGFHDGDGAGGVTGDVFKVRFAPGETGRWTWRTSSNRAGLDDRTGSFECVESDRRGPLRYDPERPWYLHWADGTVFFESGTNDPECFLASRFLTQEERYEGIDYLASQGVDILYMGVVNAGPGDGTPEMKVTPWTGSFESPDFDNICLDFMNRLEGVVEYLRGHGMVAHIVLYLDDCCEIAGSISPQAEERLIRHLGARFGSYPGIVWNLAEEYDECFDSTWCASRAGWFKEYDTLGHPVTVHHLSSDRFPFPGHDNFDMTALQFNFTDPDSLNSMINGVREQVSRAGRPVPVSLIEWTPIAPSHAEQARKGMWAIAAGGGTYQVFNKVDSEPMSAEFDRWEEIWQYARIVRETLESLPLDRMSPLNSVMSRGYCLAAPGEVYLACLPGGGDFTMEVVCVRGQFDAHWIDPRTGQRHELGPVQPGVISLGTPTDEDWVLVLE